MANSSSNRWMPTVGGVLNIVSGALGIFGSIILFIMPIILQAMYDEDPVAFQGLDEVIPMLTTIFVIIGVIIIIMSIVCLIGGITAIQRKRWGLALTGSICSVLSNSITGIIALIFIVMSRQQFAGQDDGTPAE